MTCYLSRISGQKKNEDKSLTFDLHSSIVEADADAWDSIVEGRNVFLTRRFLTAVERAKTPVCHAIFRQGKKPVGVASFQVADFKSGGLDSYLDFRCPIARKIVSPIRQIHIPDSFPMVVCGSPFVSGELGYIFLEEVTLDVAVAALLSSAKAAKARTDSQAAASSSGILFKEFFSSSQELVQGLCDGHFVKLKTDPAMMLTIDPTWKTFEDYQASLSSKYRINANRAYQKSKDLFVKELDEGEIDSYRGRIFALYQSVVERAGTRLGTLNVDTLLELRKRLADALIVQGYFLQDKLVGFLMAFVNGNCLEAGFVGFDSEQNRKHSIYPRMLYDYLKIAMDRNLGHVNYGRTAGEIKSTLGAVPQEMVCCLSVDKKILNTLLPLVTGRVKLLPFQQRKPFKKEWYENKEPIISRNFLEDLSVRSKDTVL